MSTHATITVVMDDTIMMNGVTYDGYLDYIDILVKNADENVRNSNR